MKTQSRQGLHESPENLHEEDMNDQIGQYNVEKILTTIEARSAKKSFLVFKQNKYFTVATKNIAFFYVRYESSVIVCFDKQEYFINYSLEQIRSMVKGKKFFRVNRQYLINFSAVKEVEHYFARKLLVNLTVPAPEKLVVPKLKVSCFLEWLENR